MDDLFSYLIVGLIGFIIGWWLKEQVMIYNMLKNSDKVIASLEHIRKLQAEYLEEEVPATSTLSGTEVSLEVTEGQVYAWVKDTNQFISQGATIEEAIKNANARYPGKKFRYNKVEQSNQTA